MFPQDLHAVRRGDCGDGESLPAGRRRRAGRPGG